MENKIIKNKYGYYQVSKYPSEEELSDYYSNKYYSGQSNSITFKNKYTEEEIDYIFSKAERWKLLVSRFINQESNAKLKFLDIGCGEGFSLQYFYEQGFDVLGLDYSSEGIEQQNPSMKKMFIQGNIYVSIDNLILNKNKFDVILMQNLLEHIINPNKILEICNHLLSDTGLLLIDVPNDFNSIQKYLLDNNKTEKEFWVCLPDHLSYFNKEGLINLCKECGFDNLITLCTEIIEIYALNNDSNYLKDKSKGPNCHLARMEFEKIINNISKEKSIDLYVSLAELGLGRNLLGVFRKI